MNLIRPGLAALSKMNEKMAAKAATRPFYSAVDKAITEITAKQPKGTGDQYLAMIMKTKGVKPAEIKDRGLDVALKGKGKTTGEELQRIADENPPPQVKERVLDDTQIDYDDDAERAVITNPTHYGEEYADYRTPGGENYREVLFHLPMPKSQPAKPKTLAELQQEGYTVGNFQYNRYTDQGSYKIYDPNGNWVSQRTGAYGVSTPEQALIGYGQDQARKAADDVDKSKVFKAPHFGGQNKQLLAHARVQDVTGPNGEKIMLIDEIQSDWHQAGRKKGYRTQESEKKYKDAEQQYEDYKESLSGRIYEKMIAGGIDEKEALHISENIDSLSKAGLLGEEEKYRQLANYQQFDPDNLPPDAPFKKNWHELVMKRLVDDAVKGGYDRVVITPGAEQAKRYDLSQKVDYIDYIKNEDGTYRLGVVAKGGEGVDLPKESFTAEELPDVLGNEVANKIIAGEGKFGGGRKTLRGVDLEIGGEGMKGFYDTILPTYVKKQYGVEVGQHPMKTQELQVVGANGGEGFAVIRPGGGTIAKYPTIEEAQAAAVKMGEVPYHSFDITPEMRESITTQGQPLYQVAPVAGAVGAGMMATSEEPEQYKKGGAVRKPVSMDAMRLATLNKQRK